MIFVFIADSGSKKNLNQDQVLFYLLCKSVINGSLVKDLVGKALGPLCHSRWLTLGQRILCHYIKTKNPCKKLIDLTEFVIRAYGSVWFQARKYPKGTDAPRHYFKWMQALKSCPAYVLKGVSTIFENGLYWCHSENLILSALADEDSRTREKAVAQILKIRNDPTFKALKNKEENEIKRAKKCTFKKQRVFVKPTINYDAASYIDMINWETQAYYEPPYTSDLTDDKIRSFKESPLSLEICSNSVQTERMIRDVNRVAPMSTSDKVRDGMVRGTLDDRKAKPRLETKTDLLAGEIK